MQGLKDRDLLTWHWQMMKVNKMVMYVSEMKWDLHDNHNHKIDMAFADEDESEERQKPVGQEIRILPYSYNEYPMGLLQPPLTFI